MSTIGPTIAPVIPPTLGPTGGPSLPWDQSGGSAPWTPAALGAAVIMWLHSERFVTEAGGVVSTWANLGSDGSALDVTQATEAARPAYDTTAPNGRHTVSFDGTDDTLKSAQRAVALAQPYTIVAVVHSHATLNSKYPCAGDGAANRSDIGVNNASTFFSYAGGAQFPLTPSITILNTWHALLGEYTGASSVLYADNVAGSALDPGTHGYRGTTLGSLYNTAGTFWSGHITEYLVINRLLSVGEKATLYAYQRAEWGI